MMIIDQKLQKLTRHSIRYVDMVSFRQAGRLSLPCYRKATISKVFDDFWTKMADLERKVSIGEVL